MHGIYQERPYLTEEIITFLLIVGGINHSNPKLITFHGCIDPALSHTKSHRRGQGPSPQPENATTVRKIFWPIGPRMPNRRQLLDSTQAFELANKVSSLDCSNTYNEEQGITKQLSHLTRISQAPRIQACQLDVHLLCMGTY